MTEQLHFHFSLSYIGEGNGNPLQYACLENPRDGGAWWQEEASQLFVGHSPWGGSGEREVRVPPDVVGLGTGFKSSIEIKC